MLSMTREPVQKTQMLVSSQHNCIAGCSIRTPVKQHSKSRCCLGSGGRARCADRRPYQTLKKAAGLQRVHGDQSWASGTYRCWGHASKLNRQWFRRPCRRYVNDVKRDIRQRSKRRQRRRLKLPARLGLNTFDICWLRSTSNLSVDNLIGLHRHTITPVHTHITISAWQAWLLRLPSRCL